MNQCENGFTVSKKHGISTFIRAPGICTVLFLCREEENNTTRARDLICHSEYLQKTHKETNTVSAGFRENDPIVIKLTAL